MGQTPATAFPVCGSRVFNQDTVPLCYNNGITANGCGYNYGDLNPFWYQFTCFQSGTLEFLITPNNPGDDYDWQLFDITNRSPNDLYTDSSLFVVGNWSGTYGVTGTVARSQNLNACFSNPADHQTTFSQLPSLIQGHVYLLLVSHFTSTQSGYQLAFNGGSAVITDKSIPSLKQAYSICDGQTISVTTNKKMKCNSIAADGSDFSISDPSASIISASGFNCSNSFDVDSIIISFNKPLSVGNYTITIKNGSDGNTLLDDCNNSVPKGQSLSFTVTQNMPSLLDSMTNINCSAKSLQLVFDKKIDCQTIADDGSDFVILGTPVLTIIGARGACVNGVSNVVNINLSAPITAKGNYQVKLVKGSDGNTILNECGLETPEGSTLNFTTKDNVSANFNYKVFESCTIDSITLFHDGRNGVNQWLWNFNNSSISNKQDPVAYFIEYGIKKIQLIVSNGICSDTVSKAINLDNTLKASFETNNMICPEDTASFVNNSIGNISGYYWNFGDGTSSTQQNPISHHYPILNNEKTYTVNLVVRNDAGCLDTSGNNLKVLKSCYIAVPNAFTPNVDGINDFLYPLNAFKADDMEFSVYNRFGQLVFHTTDRIKKWDGTLNGHPQNTGIYVWMLKYINHDNGKRVFQKGSTILIR